MANLHCNQELRRFLRQGAGQIVLQRGAATPLKPLGPGAQLAPRHHRGESNARSPTRGHGERRYADLNLLCYVYAHACMYAKCTIVWRKDI
eukprot:6190209-Pleurochrysis_carterae.AAC.3